MFSAVSHLTAALSTTVLKLIKKRAKSLSALYAKLNTVPFVGSTITLAYLAKNPLL
jgi:hypothetical protein